METKIKVFIVDDHPIFRKGLILLLKEIKIVDVIGEASNGRELIDFLDQNKEIEIILLEYLNIVPKSPHTKTRESLTIDKPERIFPSRDVCCLLQVIPESDVKYTKPLSPITQPISGLKNLKLFINKL